MCFRIALHLELISSSKICCYWGMKSVINRRRAVPIKVWKPELWLLGWTLETLKYKNGNRFSRHFPPYRISYFPSSVKILLRDSSILAMGSCMKPQNWSSSEQEQAIILVTNLKGALWTLPIPTCSSWPLAFALYGQHLRWDVINSTWRAYKLLLVNYVQFCCVLLDSNACPFGHCNTDTTLNSHKNAGRV